MLKRLIYLMTAIQILIGCSTLQHTATYSDITSFQNQRSASVELELLELDEIDTLIRLNNRILSDHIETELRIRTAASDRLEFQDIKLNFKRQFIYLECIINIIDEDKNTISVSASGEILLRFGGDRLEWFPLFTGLEITSRDFSTPEFTESTLRDLNSEIAVTFINGKNNAVPLNVIPLGEVRVGALLPELSPTPALFTQVLTGVVNVIDYVILIDSGVTSIALDLAFTQGNTPCPSTSGCTMYSEPVYDPEPETIITHVSLMEARKGFAVLKEEFETRTAGFLISGEKPDIALVETRRAFLHEALQKSLLDININAEFKVADLFFPEFSAQLQAFDTEDVICEHRECPSLPLCKADLSQCKRLRDTRDCSTCVFRNPLNNRCVREEIDQECASEQAFQNTRFDAERAACINQAETLKRDCDEANSQTLLNCQLESNAAYESCAAVKRGIDNLAPGTPLASVNAQAQASGTLQANFSNFRIENELERLKLDMGLKSDLQLNGKFNFRPGKLRPVLAKCISPSSGSFKSRFIAMPTVNNLISRLEHTSNELTAHWSGFGLMLHGKPAPLAPMTAGGSQLLSDCNIVLKPGTVEQTLSGKDANFFLGQLHIETQPRPTIIRFAPATITMGDRVFSGLPRLTSRNLSYDISD